MDDINECLYTTAEYAALYGVTRRTVQRWIESGLIFAVRIGRGFKIPCDEPSPQTLDIEPEPEEIEEDVDPDIIPESIEEEDLDFESEFTFEIANFGFFDESDLRRIEVSFSDAVNYARDIPLPPEMISIIFDPDLRIFRVRVDYSETQYKELTE